MEAISSHEIVHSRHFALFKSSHFEDMDTTDEQFCMDNKDSSISTVTYELCNDQQSKTKDYCLESAACLLPHPTKVWKGGEDAYFVTPQVIAVADGKYQSSLHFHRFV